MRQGVTVAVAVLLLGVACSHRNAVGPPQSFGHDGDRLLVTPEPIGPTKISRKAARRILDRPFEKPSVVHPVVVFDGYGTLGPDAPDTGEGSGTGLDHRVVSLASLAGRSVWIRVSKGDVGAHSCPAIPGDLPPGKVLVPPPAAPPFAFAVAVDAQTGDEADWSEGSSSSLCPTIQDR